VKVEGARVRDIGKGLSEFNAFDTGIFFCSPAIFTALERLKETERDVSLSAAVRTLAASGKVQAVDARGLWIDVDDPVALKRAERALLHLLRDKFNDGPVARYLNRPVSIMFSRHLAKYHVTPDSISACSFLCSVLAAALLALSGYPALLAGGILAQFASIIDGSDGEVARLTYQNSEYGGWLDAVLDRYADAFLLFGLTWHCLAQRPEGWVVFAGFMAVIGSFMLSYTADKYDSLMLKRAGAGRRAGPRLGRDVRVFLIFLGAVANLALPALVLIAVVMNLETVRRVVVMRNA